MDLDSMTSIQAGLFLGILSRFEWMDNDRNLGININLVIDIVIAC